MRCGIRNASGKPAAKQPELHLLVELRHVRGGNGVQRRIEFELLERYFREPWDHGLRVHSGGRLERVVEWDNKHGSCFGRGREFGDRDANVADGVSWNPHGQRGTVYAGCGVLRV